MKLPSLLSLHRVRCRLVGGRTAVINQIRGFLIERGITVRQGPRPLRKALSEILSSPPEAPSPRIVRLIVDLSGLEERIEAVSSKIETLAENDGSCQRLMTVPGVGPIISSAVRRSATAPASTRAVIRHADSHAGPDRNAPHARPNKLMQHLTFVVLEICLATRGRANTLCHDPGRPDLIAALWPSRHPRDCRSYQTSNRDSPDLLRGCGPQLVWRSRALLLFMRTRTPSYHYLGTCRTGTPSRTQIWKGFPD